MKGEDVEILVVGRRHSRLQGILDGKQPGGRLVAYQRASSEDAAGRTRSRRCRSYVWCILDDLGEPISQFMAYSFWLERVAVVSWGGAGNCVDDGFDKQWSRF